MLAVAYLSLFIYLLVNAAQRKNCHTVCQKSQSLVDKFSSLGDIYVTWVTFMSPTSPSCSDKRCFGSA